MQKRAIFLLLALTILASVAYADLIAAPKFTVSVEPVIDKILDPAEDHAEFYVTVKNGGAQEEKFKLLLPNDPRWTFQMLPDPSIRELSVASGGSGKFHILVKGNVPNGIHSVRARVQILSTMDVIDGFMRIQVGETKAPTPPKPDFTVETSVPAQMDPKGTYNVIVNIVNNNARLLKDVEIRLGSKLINEQSNVTIEPNETKSISFAVIMMGNEKPQTDQMHVAVNYEGTEYYAQDFNFEVVEYLPPFKTEVNVEKKFLREDRTIKVTNEGNAAKTDTIRIETSLKERFFSRSEPKYQLQKESGKYYFTWPISLSSEQSTEIKLTTSYRILLVVMLALLLYIIYKLATSNPIIVRKKVQKVHHTQPGAISAMAVIIRIKNRGKLPVRNIRVVESVPKMAQLKNDSWEGSMHPAKMHSRMASTLLEYRFAEIAPGDDRIIKYKVYSKLHIFGMLSLNPTKVEYTTKSGKTRVSKSNIIGASSAETFQIPENKRKRANEDSPF